MVRRRVFERGSTATIKDWIRKHLRATYSETALRSYSFITPEIEQKHSDWEMLEK